MVSTIATVPHLPAHDDPFQSREGDGHSAPPPIPQAQPPSPSHSTKVMPNAHLAMDAQRPGDTLTPDQLAHLPIPRMRHRASLPLCCTRCGYIEGGLYQWMFIT